MKCIRQLVILTAVLAAFVLFNYGIYAGFTARYRDNSESLMREKSIELDKYLPFDANSRIVQYKSDMQLTGELPVLDGATALFPLYSAFMNATYPSGSCVFDGQDFTKDSRLQKRGTSGAYQAVIEGSADIIFVAQPSEQQKQYAVKHNAELVYVPIGYEAFVFIVNAQNPVETLTVDQIKGIFSGKYTNWEQLGGADAAIQALQRVENSGSQTAMLAFMGDTPIKTSIALPGGRSIGYSFRYYVSDISGKENVKMLSVNQIYPNAENIRNGAYPITDSFYAVYRADNPNENIPLFIDWVLSDEGRLIVDETGYVS